MLRKRPLAVASQTITPPLQITVPPNPQHSSPSTESTSSRESKIEHHTDAAANDFLWATWQAIRKQLGQHAWYPHKYQLETTAFMPLG